MRNMLEGDSTHDLPLGQIPGTKTYVNLKNGSDSILGNINKFF